MMNQQAMLAEAMRQGQQETEQRMVAMKALLGSTGPNPLIAFFNNDRVIAELQIDTTAIKNVFYNGYLKSPVCLMPCFWPHQIIMGMPCVFLASLNAVDAAAKAHHLILREHSIEYRVDPYPAIGSVGSGMMAVKPCCDLFQGNAGGFHEVYALEDVSHVGVQPCAAESCGSPTASDTLVVKVSTYLGGMSAAAAIDGPKDGEDFAALVLRQKQVSADAGGVHIPADVREAYNKYTSGSAGNMMGSMMYTMGGAGGMRAGMQMQAMAMQQQMSGVPTAQGPVVEAQVMGRDDEDDLPTNLAKLKALHDAGVLDEKEFKAAKAKLLS